MGKRTLLLLAVLCSFSAAVISYFLLMLHVTGAAGPAWFVLGCSQAGAAGGADCAAVLGSPYSYFPAKPSGAPDGLPHIPVALLGLMYYSALATWLAAVGRPSRDRRRYHLIPLVAVLFGLLGSAHYLWVMFTVMTEWCPWCLVTHILNALIAFCIVLLWPRKADIRSLPGTLPKSMTEAETADGAGTDSTGAASDPLPIERGHPSSRLVVLTAGTIMVLMFAELSFLGLKTWRSKATALSGNFNICKTEYERITADGVAFMEQWRVAEKRDIDIRPDDPILRAPESDLPPFTVVVFSDFECAACRAFSEFVDKRAVPLFGGNMTVVFKHYPLNSECNPRSPKTRHQEACFAAEVAEAARSLGGGDAFRRAHDYLFSNQDLLKRHQLSPKSLADELLIDRASLEEAMKATSVYQRIEQDVEQAGMLDVSATPAVFADGRRVDRGAVRNLAFWDKLADVYWGRLNKPRPQSTRPSPVATTPDTPDRQAAP